MRCPTCDAMVLRVARTPTGLWLDPTGARLLSRRARRHLRRNSLKTKGPFDGCPHSGVFNTNKKYFRGPNAICRPCFARQSRLSRRHPDGRGACRTPSHGHAGKARCPLALRCATDLARLWQQGRAAPARDLLAPIYAYSTSKPPGRCSSPHAWPKLGTALLTTLLKPSAAAGHLKSIERACKCRRSY